MLEAQNLPSLRRSQRNIAAAERQSCAEDPKAQPVPSAGSNATSTNSRRASLRKVKVESAPTTRSGPHAPFRSPAKNDNGLCTPPATVSTASIAEGRSSTTSWSAKDDEILMQARAQGLNWSQIAPKHFLSKTPNACRKRHERLMKRQKAEQWDGVGLELLSYCGEDLDDSGIWHSDLEEENVGGSEVRAYERKPPLEKMVEDSTPKEALFLYNNEPQRKYQSDEETPTVQPEDEGVQDLHDVEISIASGGQNRAVHGSVASRPPSLGAVDDDMSVVPLNLHETSFESRSRSTESVLGSSLLEYSSSDSMDEVDAVGARKEQIMNRLMIRFHGMFDTSGRYSCHETQEPSTHNSAATGSQVSRTQGRHSSKKANKKRNSGERADDEKSDNDENSARKRPRKSGSSDDADAEDKKRLACPFFKHNPERYRAARSCPGPGWNSTHRIKEHIYRVHTLPSYCPRCNKSFENEVQLSDHLRTLNNCRVREKVSMEGIDKDQEKKLKSRKEVFRAANEEEKWKHVYLILFPNTPTSALPSPYYNESDDNQELPEGESPKSREIVQLQEYMRRELPRIVRQELKRAIDETLAPIEENLTNRLESIVRGCHETASRAFLSNLNTAPGFSNNGLYAANDTNEFFLGSLPDDLAPYAPPPDSIPLPWDIDSHPMALPATFPELINYSDSSIPHAPGAASSSSFLESPSLSLNDSTQYTGMMSDLDTELILPYEAPQDRTLGKGKERAQCCDPTDQVIHGSHDPK